jgi:DNA polymerase I-like protein with 3'-5' exonuclease and polymerase domains
MKLRSMIMAPKGKVLIACDLSQAESWIVAYRANEPRMKQALNFGDIHRETAMGFFPKPPEEIITEERYIGKQFNHASSYRMGPERAAEVINKKSDQPPFVTVSLPQAKEFSRKWHQLYNVKTWWGDIEEQLNRNRTIVTTYGRKRTFFAAWGNELFKEATAFEPQSTVADHFNGATHPELGIKGGLLEIYRRVIVPSKGELCIVNQAHDSLMIECPTEMRMEIAQQMTAILRRPLVINGEEFIIPSDCEMGERWGEMDKVKIA